MQNVLRIEIIDFVELYIILINLFELISIVNEEQTNFDVQNVQNMINFYLINERTIIFVVI